MAWQFSSARYMRGQEGRRPEVLPQANPEALPEVTVKGVPPQVLSSYKLKIRSAERKSPNSWLLNTPQGEYLLRELPDQNIQVKTIELYLQLLEQGIANLFPLEKTKSGKAYEKTEGKLYYLTHYRKGNFFKGDDISHLRLAAKNLAILHRQTGGWGKEQSKKQNLWLTVKQNRLRDLLTYLHYLKQNKVLTDFERLFMENFDFFYDQGQESLEHMVLAGQEEAFIINNLLPENITLLDDKLVFLDITKWNTGPQAMDFSLLLNSYLPLHRWDLDLIKDLITQYHQENPLDQKARHLLLAQLRFPRRYWLYSHQYFSGQLSSDDLTPKLKRYILECYWRDICLDQLENWLIGEWDKNDSKE
ncbi:hypothetical protein BR63_14480 [Thermanaerosceptrum fracticalcis]|uniref:CotS family spore coat protein n=1 Tax=Thermanaerosceptrum fracticalcis TaxID=1712410 RepID=A0A7G6E5N5_THEFR|nr:hypothetical protein [Thermanaerosceptrum fracticalcis]QNB47389.1 hypothetical protein BR63_14480 [Thermanaerosceptrum fracticalcis]